MIIIALCLAKFGIFRDPHNSEKH